MCDDDDDEKKKILKEESHYDQAWRLISREYTSVLFYVLVLCIFSDVKSWSIELN